MTEPKRIDDAELDEMEIEVGALPYVSGLIAEAKRRGQELAEINGALKVLLALWEHGDPKVFDAKFYDVIAKYAK